MPIALQFGTNASGTTWWSNFGGTTYNWPNLEPMQVAFVGVGVGEITQVKESVPWVRCASGNVYIVYFHSALTFLEGWVKIYNVEMVKF